MGLTVKVKDKIVPNNIIQLPLPAKHNSISMYFTVDNDNVIVGDKGITYNMYVRHTDSGFKCPVLDVDGIAITNRPISTLFNAGGYTTTMDLSKVRLLDNITYCIEFESDSIQGDTVLSVITSTGIVSNSTPVPTAPLLPFMDTFSDDIPQTATAFRLLNSAHSGPIVDIQNDAGVTIGIGVDASGELDEVALLAHIGSGDGKVIRRIDQSGNGNDLVSVVGEEPLIASAGVIYKKGSYPAMFAPAPTTSMALSAPIAVKSVFYIRQQVRPGGLFNIGLGDSIGNQYIGAMDSDGTNNSGNPIHYINGALGDGQAYSNTKESRVLFSATSYNYTSATFATGGDGNFIMPQEFLQDIIVYDVVVSETNRVAIEQYMSDNYGIGGPNDPPIMILDKIPNAWSAISFSRKLRADYTGNAMLLRRSDNLKVNVGFTPEGKIDIAKVTDFLGVFGPQAYIERVYDQSGNGNDWVELDHTKQFTFDVSVDVFGYTSASITNPSLLQNMTLNNAINSNDCTIAGVYDNGSSHANVDITSTGSPSSYVFNVADIADATGTPIFGGVGTPTLYVSNNLKSYTDSKALLADISGDEIAYTVTDLDLSGPDWTGFQFNSTFNGNITHDPVRFRKETIIYDRKLTTTEINTYNTDCVTFYGTT